MKWLNFFKRFKSKNKDKIIELGDLDLNEREDYIKSLRVTANLADNLQIIKEVFGNSFDLNIKRFKIGQDRLPTAIVYLSGLAANEAIKEIIESIEINLLEFQSLTSTEADIVTLLDEQLLNNKQTSQSRSFFKIFEELAVGFSILFIEGKSKAIICDTQGVQLRNITEPDTEVTIRGPRDGFIENLSINTSLIRQRIRTPNLWIEGFEIGSLSKTKVTMAYIKGLANEELLAEVKSRLKRIKIDTILESGYIQELIHDEAFTIFPLIQRTERPDKVVSSLVEGRVAIFTDNTPFVLILPIDFNLLLQSPDDYYEVFPIGTPFRLLRYISFVVSILLPGVYAAVLSFHQEFIPSTLFLQISTTREEIPFPLLVEIFIMEVLFELLREAGVRLPKAFGSTISIVGALILGEAAISAGLVSPPVVIIVATTAIASFTNPSYVLAIAARFIRFAFLLLGGSFGLFGIQFGLIILIIHLCSLRSFGQPYFQPFAPLIFKDLKDSMVRLPFWAMVNRPKLFGGREPKRAAKDQKPKPPKEREN